MSTLHDALLPVLLATLLFRAFLPPGFMSSPGGDGLRIRSVLCSMGGERGDLVQLPGAHAPGCDHCLAPLLGTSHELPRVVAIGGATPFLAIFSSQLSQSPLARAQAARAPPVV